MSIKTAVNGNLTGTTHRRSAGCNDNLIRIGSKPITLKRKSQALIPFSFFHV